MKRFHLSTETANDIIWIVGIACIVAIVLGTVAYKLLLE